MSADRPASASERSATLSVCLIVRDEADRLPSALESVAGVAREVVVADTGSSDNTIPIARARGARVIEIPWEEDFSKARNAGLDRATGDWILCLDADERLARNQTRKIHRMTAGRKDAYFVQIRSPLGGDRAGQTFVHSFPRFFRNRPEFRFQGRVHEQMYPSLEAARARIGVSNLEIEHIGYALDTSLSQTKLRRNLRLLLLDRADHPEDALVHFHLGETYALLEEPVEAISSYERALDTGRLPPAHRAVARQNLASALLKMGEFQRAIEQSREALKNNPGALTPLLVQASARCRLGDYGESIRMADRYLKRCGRSGSDEQNLMGFAANPAQAFLIRGECNLRKGRPDRAKSDARKAILASPNWAGGHRLMARAQVESGDLQGGLETVNAAIAQSRQGNLFAYQGLLRIKAGDLEGAVDSYRRLLEMEPESAEAHRRLAGLYQKLGFRDQAREHLIMLDTARGRTHTEMEAPF